MELNKQSYTKKTNTTCVFSFVFLLLKKASPRGAGREEGEGPERVREELLGRGGAASIML